ncbi:MAG TPA: adenosylhomocysteinase [Gaiellaceae bacterium]|nr:adenosylhomocysteinase [Gaiellaceae bacterium]
MGSRIEWVISSCRLLAAIGDELESTRPFEGLRIGTGIHLEPKTVALLLTLQRGGAEVISTGNLNTTQQEAIDFLEVRGIQTVGGPTADPHELDGYLREVLAARPQLLLDNGGDLFVRWLDDPYGELLGGTEETTSGRMRLVPLREQIRRPVLVINDSPIKQFAENRHAVGQSVLESFMRITNRATNGRRVVVFGYGACGKGVAANFRNAYAEVSVVEVDPVLRLEALLDGFQVPDRDEALERANVVITVTGARDVVTPADLPLLADDVVLANAGHFPFELDVAGIEADGSVAERTEATDGIATLRLADGRRIHILTGGHMVNLAGPHPLGNSIESMDLGFALQARCLEAVARGNVGAESCVVPVPRAIDAAVASAYVRLAS